MQAIAHLLNFEEGSAPQKRPHSSWGRLITTFYHYHCYQRRHTIAASLLFLLAGILFQMPHHRVLAFTLAIILPNFGIRFVLAAMLSAILPEPPWYILRKARCQCGQPPIKPPNEAFLPEVEQSNALLKQRQKIRKFFLAYGCVLPYLWFAILFAVFACTREDNTDLAFVAFIGLVCSHLLLFGAFLPSIHPPRQRRHRYLIYCPCMPREIHTDTETIIYHQ